ncbi:Hypothetical_protein [Hexamita inflata]|uniref:Hypothetical_protein n=1 Tax=Hexamita inflata TaxID=28002 RepID=A0AA86NIY0_9EUKA|nr:Hypothetical protein HINF_LOCUS8230 [Hexamita inflata]
MTLIMSTQGKDTDQLLTFSKQDQQLLCEYEIDEIEANIKLTFSAPQYTINNNRYSILNDHGDWIDVLLPTQRKIDDETQLLYFIQNLSDENYKYWIDNDYFLNNNKLKFKATGFKALKSDDHYFCKAFGLIKGTTYECDAQGFITATNILYPYIYKYICINCYDIQDYTLIDQGQKRYLLLKQFRTWNSGTITQVTSDIIVTFQINQLIKGFRVQFQDEMYQELQLNGDDYTLELYINKSKKVLMRIQQQEEARILREQEFEYKKQIEQQRQAAVQQQYIEQEQQAQLEAQNIQAQQESVLQKQEDLWRSKQRILNDNEFTRYVNQNYDLLQSKKSQKVILSKMFKKKQLKAQQFLLGVQQLDEEIEELEESRLQLLFSLNRNGVKMSVQDLGDTAEGHFPKVVKRDPDEQMALSERQTIQGPLSINELNNSVHPPVVKVDPNEVIPQQELQPQQQSQHPPIVKIDPTEHIVNTDQSDIQVVDSGTQQRLQAEQRRQEIINQPEQPSSWNFDTNQNGIPIIKNENQMQDNQIQTDPEQIYQEFDYIQDMLLQEQAENIQLKNQLESEHEIERQKQYFKSLIYQLQQIQTEEDKEVFLNNNPNYEQFLEKFEQQYIDYFVSEEYDAYQRIQNNKNQPELQVLEQQPLEDQQVSDVFTQPPEFPFEEQLKLMSPNHLKQAYETQPQRSQQISDYIYQNLMDKIVLTKTLQETEAVKEEYNQFEEIIRKRDDYMTLYNKIYYRLFNKKYK